MTHHRFQSCQTQLIYHRDLCRSNYRNEDIYSKVWSESPIMSSSDTTKNAWVQSNLEQCERSKHNISYSNCFKKCLLSGDMRTRLMHTSYFLKTLSKRKRIVSLFHSVQSFTRCVFPKKAKKETTPIQFTEFIAAILPKQRQMQPFLFFLFYFESA